MCFIILLCGRILWRHFSTWLSLAPPDGTIAWPLWAKLNLSYSRTLVLKKCSKSADHLSIDLLSVYFFSPNKILVFFSVADSFLIFLRLSVWGNHKSGKTRQTFSQSVVVCCRDETYQEEEEEVLNRRVQLCDRRKSLSVPCASSCSFTLLEGLYGSLDMSNHCETLFYCSAVRVVGLVCDSWTQTKGRPFFKYGIFRFFLVKSYLSLKYISPSIVGH